MDRFALRPLRAAPLLLAAAACLTGSAGLAYAQSQVAPEPNVVLENAAIDYPVGPGDVLRISVYRSPDMDTTVRVSDQGAIVVASLGEVKVAGLTASGIADRLRSDLIERKILTNPSVNVLVTEIHSKVVMVMGAVERPGEMALDRPNLTITSVLARAGANFGTGSGMVTVVEGTAPDAPRQQFRIGDIVSGKDDRPVRPGETIIVRAPPTVYVSGEVLRAGAFPIEPGMTVGQAIALGGGATPRGTVRRVQLSRKDASGKITMLKSVKLDTPVSADDLIVVQPRIF